MITEERLNEWSRLADEASPGPWKQVGVVINDSRNSMICECRGWALGQRREHNSEFITISRTAVPQLIAEVRAMRKVVAAARTMQKRLDACEHWPAVTRGKSIVEIWGECLPAIEEALKEWESLK